MHRATPAAPAEETSSSDSVRAWPFVALALASVVLLVALMVRRAPTPPVGAQLWAVPSFAFVDHLGRPTSSEALRGAPYVASFFFTRCPTACPLLTSKLTRVQEQTRGRGLAFVSFSLDPEHDTPSVLAEFALAWRPDETRWHLLPTTEATLRDALAAFRVTARTTSEPGNPILHSSAFFLVDAEGFVRGVYPSDDDREVERLTRDAVALSNTELRAP